MGADYLYISPCCESQDFEEIIYPTEDEPNGFYRCNICQKTFNKPILEDVDYGDEK